MNFVWIFSYIGFFLACIAELSLARHVSRTNSRHRTIGSYRRWSKFAAGIGLTSGISSLGLASFLWHSRDDYSLRKRIVFGDRVGFVDVPNSVKISDNFWKNKTNEEDDEYVCIKADLMGNFSRKCLEPGIESENEVWHGVCCEDIQENEASRDKSICCFVNFNGFQSSNRANKWFVLGFPVAASLYYSWRWY